jgi:hypothetical protein
VRRPKSLHQPSDDEPSQKMPVLHARHYAGDVDTAEISAARNRQLRLITMDLIFRPFDKEGSENPVQQSELQGPQPARGEILLDLQACAGSRCRRRRQTGRVNSPMPIHRQELLALWVLENIPCCDVGTELAKTFLETCGEGVDRLGSEEPVDRITRVMAGYRARVETRQRLRTIATRYKSWL